MCVEERQPILRSFIAIKYYATSSFTSIRWTFRFNILVFKNMINFILRNLRLLTTVCCFVTCIRSYTAMCHMLVDPSDFVFLSRNAVCVLLVTLS